MIVKLLIDNIFIERLGFNISHFKAFGMTNMEYERRIPQKIYNRATMTENVYYEIYLNILYFSLVNINILVGFLNSFLEDHLFGNFLFLFFFFNRGDTKYLILVPRWSPNEGVRPSLYGIGAALSSHSHHSLI